MSFPQSDPPRHPLDRPPSERPAHPLERPPSPQPVLQEEARPVRQRVPIPYSAPIFTYLILAANILVYLADVIIFDGNLTQLGAKDNPSIRNGELWRLITPMFLHGGIIHLGFNSYFLYVIGPQVERAFGYIRFLGIYFLAGLGGSIASFWLTPGPAIGASGALFGLIGALLPFLFLNRTILANTQQRISSIIQVIVINLVIGFASQIGNSPTLPRIDNWGHVGGLIGGLAAAALVAPRYVVQGDPFTGIRIEDTSSPVLSAMALAFIGAALGSFLLFLLWAGR